MGTAKLPGPLTQAIVKEIKAERARQGMSQRAVYEAASMAKNTYERIESLERQLDTEQLGRIADALDLMASELVLRAEALMGREQLRLVPVPMSVPTPTVPVSGDEWDEDEPVAAHDLDYSIEEEQEATQQEP